MIYSIGVIFLVLIAWNIGNNRRLILFLTFIFLTSIALIFDPAPGMDLYRHYEALESFRALGYEATVGKYAHNMEDLPVYSVVFYVISLLSHNKLLLVFTYIVIYGCWFSILSMYIRDAHLNNRYWTVGYTVIMLTANAYAMTGIRNMLACAVVFLFLYIDLCRNKKKLLSMVMYVLMCFLHDSMIVFVAFRLVLYCSKLRGYNILRYIVVLWPLAIDRIVELLGSTSNSVLISVSQKLDLYTTQEAAEQWVGGTGLEMLSLFRFAIILMFMFYLFRQSKRVRNTPYIHMIYLLALFCLGGMGNRALTDRYTNMTLMYSVPLIVNQCGIAEPVNSKGLVVQVNSFPIWIMLGGYFVCLCLFQYRYFI